MDGRKIQDRSYLGLGMAARHVGHSADAFRPSQALDPMDVANRFIRLPAAFRPATGRVISYGDVQWEGIFDGSYTQPGDYLVTRNGTFFIIAQASLQPILCVLANRTVSISRPALQSTLAQNAYGGYTPGNSSLLARGWPVSILSETKTATSTKNLPTDQPVPYLSVLLPTIPNVSLSPGDIISDDLGRSAVVIMAESTELGWRVTTKMALT